MTITWSPAAILIIRRGVNTRANGANDHESLIHRRPWYSFFSMTFDKLRFEDEKC